MSLLSKNRNARTVLALCLVLAAMAGLTAASVPLYRLFCSTTGYGGTTQVAREAPRAVADRMITVRFNTDTSAQLPWTFEPPKAPVKVHVGESALVFFTARNNAKEPITGQAVFNVAPDKAGLYFDKLQCFCFTEQRLKAGEKAEMPVTFFVDPSIMKDHNLDDIDTITLSYTFYRAKNADQGNGTKQVSHDAAAGGVTVN
ncbi:MAG: cytochrome c oxidase assembly protein [Alphaproteobacteria bacterium]